MFEMKLPSDVTFIIERMNAHGYCAHVVGGSVRDSLIGRELGDFDITTNALPEQTKAVFSDHKTVDTGIKHGTVTLVLGGVPYEITTYRIDGDYKDNRHPDEVTFTASLTEDLARRDFTVNAMAYSAKDGLTDPFLGRRDAKNRIIRAVGDPYRRFDEDALRILRALRFAATLSFDIEDNTARAARELADKLSSISKERVYVELKKLISGENAYRIIKKYGDVLSCALDGFKLSRLPEKRRFQKSDYLTRLASLIYMNSLDHTDAAEKVLFALKTDKLTRTSIVSIFEAYENNYLNDERDALRLLAKHGKEAVEGALKLGILIGKFTNDEADVLYSALSSGTPYTVAQLDIRGTDLVSMGIKGEAVGEALKALLSAVIEGDVDNVKPSLMGYLIRTM
jgi:tRNA nucleotidyltransferase (CCA-adding enzyme)